MHFAKIFHLFIIFLFINSTGNAQSTDVDTDHRGYEFLDILAGRGMLSGIYSGVNPITRERFGELLLHAEALYKSDPKLLSPRRQQLRVRLI